MIGKFIRDGQPIPERSAREVAVYDLLDRLGITYERLDHSTAATIADCEEVEALLGVEICKNLFLCNRQKTCFIFGDARTQSISYKGTVFSDRQCALVFAGPLEMEELLGVTPGSVSILALMNDLQHRVQLLVDREIQQEPWFGCHPCLNTSSLKIRTEDIFQIFLPHTGHQPIFVTLSDDMPNP